MKGSSKAKEATGQGNVLLAPQSAMEKEQVERVPYVSENARDSVIVKGQASQGTPSAENEVQQKPVSSDAEMQWRKPQDIAIEHHMMPMGSAAYNPHWNGMQRGMEGFLPPFGGSMPPFMGYGPSDVPFAFITAEPFWGSQHDDTTASFSTPKRSCRDGYGY